MANKSSQASISAALRQANRALTEIGMGTGVVVERAESSQASAARDLRSINAALKRSPANQEAQPSFELAKEYAEQIAASSFRNREAPKRG